jgi:hypothetical protein
MAKWSARSATLAVRSEIGGDHVRGDFRLGAAKNTPREINRSEGWRIAFFTLSLVVLHWHIP